MVSYLASWWEYFCIHIYHYLTAGNATSAVINSLVEAKSGIQDAAENFDSKSIIKTTKKRIGNAIVGTIEGAGNLLEQAGVYSAIDSIVHGFAGMPTKVKAPVFQKRTLGFTNITN